MQLSGGYIKAYRKTLKSDMYQVLTASQRDVFWACLLLASHTVKQWEWNGEVYTCRPGQFVTSLASIKKNCASDTSIQNIRTALGRLEKWQFLTSKSTKGGRLITIMNWDSYQADDLDANKGANKELTKSQQLSRRSKNIKNIYMPEFELFWDAYPRKVGKKKAFEAWRKCNGDRPPIETILEAIQKQTASDTWKRDNGQFIPYPATWLNGQRWEDEPVVQIQPDKPPYYEVIN